MVYKITHREELVGNFFYDASSEDEAMEKYMYDMENGFLDFWKMEMVDSADTIEPIEETEQ